MEGKNLMSNVKMKSSLRNWCGIPNEGKFRKERGQPLKNVRLISGYREILFYAYAKK